MTSETTALTINNRPPAALVGVSFMFEACMTISTAGKALRKI
ncbi:hypothetical protein [Sulfitobacter maritimus]|nr:hypothetical protein [Sulfitobacter maritimus]